MDVETVRVILERTFQMPVAESDAQIVLDRLNEALSDEPAQQSAQQTELCSGVDHSVYESVINPGHCHVCGKPLRR